MIHIWRVIDHSSVNNQFRKSSIASTSEPEKASAFTTTEVILEDTVDKEDDINLPDADVESLLQKELLTMGM
ncbi:hypothetical protein H0W32_01910 [Patescibacteria group bacterium]|nr:hypothetical protein [Patescibacteria group bacterium]